MRTPKIEQETLISYNAAAAEATVYTFDKRLIRKLHRLCDKDPSQFSQKNKCSDGSHTFIVPKKYVTVSSPRCVSATTIIAM